MKYVKMLGLLAVAAAAFMAFAATASATTVTSGGSTYTGEIHATAGTTTLHGVATVTCHESTSSGTITTHSSTTTAHGPISTLTFSNCTENNDVTVLSGGTLTAHTDPESPSSKNATLTSTNAAILIHITSLGLTCEFTTNETDVGTLTGSSTTGGHAVLMIDSVAIPRTGGSFFCGSSGEWTGTYTVTTPSNLDVD
jgi:hypothetical protein